MPGHGSKKQNQRTKGNLRPSSSSHAAELLNSVGTAPTGFIGFGQTPKYVPASSSLDDMDSSLDADFRMVLRKFTKRDATTKVKACQEFTDLCKEKSDECLQSVLPFWPRTFNKLVMDIDYRVREASQQCMAILAGRVGRNLAPYLRKLMGGWLLAQCDTYPTVASAAQLSFQSAFSPAKQMEAISYCKDKIIEYLTENLVKHTPTTLSDPKQTEKEDMENKYNRVVVSSFLALRKLLTGVSRGDLNTLQDSLLTLLGDPKLWKHGKSKISMVRSAMFSFLAGLCQTGLDLVTQYTDKMSPFILHNLDEKDPAICYALWEAVLSLISFTQECWKYVSVQKGFWPKLKNLLENGCYGNAVVIGPNILPLLSRIPQDLFTDNTKFIEDFFSCFRQGLGSSSVLKSNSECGAMITAYMECVQFVSKQQMETPLANYIIMDQVLPVIQASLLEPSSQLALSPLYCMLGKLLTGLEQTTQGPQIASVFWNSLRETAEERLFNMETSSDDFEKRIVVLVRCLYFPHTETKLKSKKVEFDTVCSDIREEESEKMKETDSSTLSKLELGQHATEFVQNLILLTFKLARKHFSSNHLHMLADLLELDSSDKTISMVIESCHGDVSPEGTLQYFVFEICMPWLMEVQERPENSSDLIYIIHIVCLFVPSLEIGSAITLLDKLYESCLDSTSERVLVKKLFNMAQNCTSVKTWVQGTKFGEKWLERSRSLRKMTLGMECQVMISNTIDVLSEILKTKQNGECLVKKEYLMSVLEENVAVLEKLDNQVGKNTLDTVIQFVSRTVLLFFTQYKDSVLSDIGRKVTLRLFQICLVNTYEICDESLNLAQEAWSAGVTHSVQSTGGLLYDTCVVKQMTEMSVSVLTESVASLDKLCTLFGNVKVLLDSVQTGLPDNERENVVYTTVWSNLNAEVPVNVPSKILEYQYIKGEHPDVPEMNHEFRIQTLFTSLYNCKLLQHILPVGSESDDAGKPASCECWSEDRMECFLTCVLGQSIVQGMLKVDTMFGKLNEIRKSTGELEEIVKDLSHCLGRQGMEKLWKMAFDRSEMDTRYVASLSMVLSLMQSVWNQEEPLYLQLEPISQRCSEIDSKTVRMLHCTVGYLSPVDQVTLTELLVARILTLPVESVLEAQGTISLVSVICKLTSSIAPSHQEEITPLQIGVLDQILVWKDSLSDIFVYNSSAGGNAFSVEVSRFLSSVVVQIPAQLSDKHWDFIMCALVSWVQELKDMEEEILKSKSPGIQCLLVSVLDLVSNVSECLKVKVEADPGSYPPDLRTEWIEFFAESIFTVLLPLYVKFNRLMQQRTLSGKDQLVLASVCDAVSKSPPSFIINNELPPLLIAGDTSQLPDNLQTLMNHLCPLLLARDYSVQLSAYQILSSVMDDIPDFDKEDKSFVVDASGGEEKDEETKKSPPPHLMKIIDRCQLVLEEFLAGIAVDECETVMPDTLQFQHVFGYLLCWRLLLQFFKSAPSELRQEYAVYLREMRYVELMMNQLFKLMPKSPKKLFETPFSPNIKGVGCSLEVQHMTCDLYQMALRTIPAMVRQWWKDQDRKTAGFVDTFTTKFVSLALCAAELQSVQSTEVTMEDMKIRTRPTAREVIATYGIEEVSVEIVITLPVNHPLGNITVTSEKRVGVSGAQWEKWLLQLNIFLTHQNGNIVDGLKLWRDNISKKFQGVEECMICFYVLHGTNFQLPRITCRTCKKKFHSACLYKWFNTSHNCTCPLCRNIF